ncbi:phospholipid transport system transporter-binding protein [Vreelandella songnenensis]|uniref:Phospholipid transport system transporter-binding protein n=1 Tax=Vreelandella songnenensis TaxID=1176243 RepID=A0A2T0V7H3_9GAMM|nr:STAS domain-containing protein [Halomonas songnenensis]PRY66139.1 phospholipid transport system transporter-binding protein [Halomonas songnenensis]
MTRLLSQPLATLDVEQSTLRVTGDVGMTAAAELAAAGAKWLETGGEKAVGFDFSGVEKASSAVMSVLFEWLRTCKRHHIEVSAITLSAPLERLAALSELDALIHSPALTE